MRRWPAIVLLSISGVWAMGCGSKPSAEPASKSEPAAAVTPADSGANDGRPVIVTLGDSLTAGLGVDPRLNYPARLQAKIDAAGYRYRIVNAGVSGDTSAQGLSRLGAVGRMRPAVVIVELGANDGLRGIPAAETKKNLEEIVRMLVAGGAKVVLAGMEMPPNYGPEYTRQFRNMFPDLARTYRIGLIPFFLQGVGGIAGLNQDDGIHPTAEGYAIIVENIWPVLLPLLRK